MIPLRDRNPRTSTPWVNYILIALNLAAFAWELSLGVRFESTLASVAFVPERFWQAGGWGADGMSMLVSMFLHAGWLHIGSNMLYLWIFGDNIEDRLGHFLYLVFYLACGFAATMAHALLNAGSGLPAIGASGAIAGVLGAYLVLFPRAHVMTLIPIGFFIAVRELPALLILGLWFAIQIFSGVASIGASEAGGVAWWAHIGGFVAGLALVFVLGGTKKPAEYPEFRG
ncbi:MAG: rhomboid family intramembrane serine protease [Thermoanaerobaculia bacterium]